MKLPFSLAMCAVLAALSVMVSAVNAESIKPLMQVEACEHFTPAVVAIKTTEQVNGELGSGFIVSADGWIVTAAHTVINLQTRQNYPAIQVAMPNGTIQNAVQMTPIDDALLHDFALLKVNGSNLPFLELGDEGDTPAGNFALIGFPISAGVAMKFCLSGTVVAKASLPKGNSKINPRRLDKGNIRRTHDFLRYRQGNWH